MELEAERRERNEEKILLIEVLCYEEEISPSEKDNFDRCCNTFENKYVNRISKSRIDQSASFNILSRMSSESLELDIKLLRSNVKHS